MAKTAKTAKSAFVVSAEEEAFLVALRNLLGSADVAEDADDDEDEAEDEDDDEELEPPVREEIEALGIKDLRAAAASYGIDKKTKADILAAFEDLYEEDEDDEDEDEDEDEVDLEEMSLKELREYAKSEEGGEHTAKEIKGLDKDALIELINGDDDEDEDEEEEDEDDEDEEEVLDEEALNAMSHKELLALAKELTVKVPAALKKDTKANRKKLVEKILDSGEEE
jgi:hypothetical protein